MNEILNFIKNNYSWLIGVVIVLFILIRTKIRGYFWRVRKTNEKLKLKEFFKLWGKGIEGITPIQQSKSQVLGNIIVLVGIISGIVVNALVRMEDQWWWIEIVLVGSLILTSLSQIGALQKYWRIKKINEEIKKLEKNG